MKNNSDGGGKRGGGGRHHHKGKPTFAPNKHKKVEVSFNASDRLDYLTGFSKRKKERRAFGLAMQKVKDRQAKVEERKERREAQMEKIQDIERNKKALRKGLTGDVDVDDDGDVSDDNNDGDVDSSQKKKGQHEKELSTFQDEHTTTQFGGLVSVTTTFGIPDDDEDDDSIDFYKREKHGKDHVDTEQKRAGDVNNFMAEVKSKMNGNKSSKKSGKHGGKKGQHGASTMKGMGSAATLKMAQKTLRKFKARDGGRGGGHERGGGKGGKKRKGGRR